MKKLICEYTLPVVTGIFMAFPAVAQERKGDPKATEVWEPVPPMVKPASQPGEAPADAVVLFSGKDLGAWQRMNGSAPVWTVENGMFTVKPGTGNIRTLDKFGDCHLHLEFRPPSVVKGEGQGRGNSGVFLMSKYEVQILDNYNNRTYSNGQVGSIYKQHIPLANPSIGPGEWHVYDIIFRAPRFDAQGGVLDSARITVILNGIVLQNNTVLKGSTQFIGPATYEAHGAEEPLELQDHGDLVSFRNIWIRRL